MFIVRNISRRCHFVCRIFRCPVVHTAYVVVCRHPAVEVVVMQFFCLSEHSVQQEREVDVFVIEAVTH